MKMLTKLRPWRTCLLLLLLGMISIALGAIQLNSINVGEASSTYISTPLPIVIHIVFGIIFNLVSPFQFVATIRTKYPNLHRLIGGMLVISAFPVAITALWMNEFFPSYGGALKYTGIIAYNVVLLGSLCTAVYFIINKQVAKHKLWMMRAMAAALGPATQRLIIIPVFIVFGQEILTDQLIGILIWAGLIINLGFVEYLRRKQAGKIINKNFTEQSVTVTD